MGEDDSVMKRWMLLCAALLMIPVTVYSTGQPAVSAESAILMDGRTGEVLFEKRADQQMRIASTTKIMTALVALEHAGVQDIVSVKESHMTEGSSMYLHPGERITVEELLYGLLLSSGNDAALALADGCCGSLEHFVYEMNHKAHSIGMDHTSFANPSGLDDENHYSTARDMAKLACCASQNPALVRIASTRNAVAGKRSMHNHNRLLSSVDGCFGLKTGYTRAAGRTLVSCAARSGQLLVAVTLNDSDDWRDHAALYHYGFALLAERKEEAAS